MDEHNHAPMYQQLRQSKIEHHWLPDVEWIVGEVIISAKPVEPQHYQPRVHGLDIRGLQRPAHPTHFIDIKTIAIDETPTVSLRKVAPYCQRCKRIV